MPRRSYYAVLGVPRAADIVTIKQAYRRLALRYHPDRNQGDRSSELRFIEVTEAFEVLSDPEKRRLYDKEGSAPPQPARPAGPTTAADQIFEHFSKVLNQLFQQVSERNMTVQQGELCVRCRGRGVVMKIQGNYTMKGTCPDCRGTGRESRP